MRLILLRNAANFIVLLRIALVFVTVWLFSLPSLQARIAALALLVCVALLDGVDGYVARRCRAASHVGGLLDTLGDRIMENVLLIFFAYQRLIPLFVPIIFVVRSFIADLIRHLAAQRGIGTFAINTSRWGYAFVASPASRIAYLALKIIIFLAAGLMTIAGAPALSRGPALCRATEHLGGFLYYGSALLVLCNLVRFAFLVYDSRAVLRETFIT